MNCPTCNNRMMQRTTYEKLMKAGRRVNGKRKIEKYCEYCEWKGTTGAGAELRAAIQSRRK